MKRNYLTPTILLLAWVSLFTDIASEMLYPIMPVYLSSIGFTALWIGILEGIAEAVAGLSKAWFGNFSDRSGRRVPFVRSGYFLSAISKPMMAVWAWPAWILLARSLTDRLGKGIRTGARDAMLADESIEANRGKVFGFHRFMDTLGAAIGPSCALVYLLFFPGQYKTLFLLAFLPGIAGVLLTFLLKDKKKKAPQARLKKPFGFFSYWRQSGTGYRKVTAGLLAFALFNSSDAFLLLVAKHNGLSDTLIIGGYIFYNVVYAFVSFPAGILADRFGPKKMFITGILFFILAYASMPFAGSLPSLLTAYLFYGLYAACTDGVSKAWISMLCGREERGTALGFYAGTLSIVTLLASVAAGMIWVKFSPLTMFLFSAGGALAVAVYFILLREKKPNQTSFPASA